MSDGAARSAAGGQEVIDRSGLPRSVARLGARAEYRFTAPAPRSGSASAAAADGQLDEYLHLFLANRGVLITPFHNMALMCPVTSEADVEVHAAAFLAAVTNLLA